MNGRVLEAILVTIIHRGRLKGKALRSGWLVAVSVRIEGSLDACAVDKLCEVR